MAITNKLSAIGDAIREKTGKSELLTLDAMPGEIASIETGGGGSVEVEPVVLTSDCEAVCKGPIAGKYIELFGNTVSTKNIANAKYMFEYYPNQTIPFDINISDTALSCSIEALFRYSSIRELPLIKGNGKILQANSMFYACYYLREIPDNFFDNLNISDWATSTSSYLYIINNMFAYCYSLRHLPLRWFNYMNRAVSYTNTYFYNGFAYCSSLDELIDLPIPYTATYTNNIFYNTFDRCSRLKDIIFLLDEDGNNLIKQWKNQTITLTSSVGYRDYYNADVILNYNSGITADKEVKDDATYQALKDNPDWFTLDVNYSRYNHDSAVNTINTLPDTSTYLATAGGTNTIKFTGAAGASTDGGAINTLTEEEIAVATAKGWTVSMV